jgi:hypothetical protein
MLTAHEGRSPRRTSSLSPSSTAAGSSGLGDTGPGDVAVLGRPLTGQVAARTTLSWESAVRGYSRWHEAQSLSGTVITLMRRLRIST